MKILQADEKKAVFLFIKPKFLKWQSISSKHVQSSFVNKLVEAATKKKNILN